MYHFVVEKRQIIPRNGNQQVVECFFIVGKSGFERSFQVGQQEFFYQVSGVGVVDEQVVGMGIQNLLEPWIGYFPRPVEHRGCNVETFEAVVGGFIIFKNKKIEIEHVNSEFFRQEFQVFFLERGVLFQKHGYPADTGDGSRRGVVVEVFPDAFFDEIFFESHKIVLSLRITKLIKYSKVKPSIMKNFPWKYLPAFLLPAVFMFYSCSGTHLRLSRITASQTPIDSSIAADPGMRAVIRPYKDSLEREMQVVLAYAKADYFKQDGAETGETAIGDFMADVCQRRGGEAFRRLTGKRVDFTLLNYGGIRDGISRGEIRVETAYRIMPFENAMVVVELTGEKTEELLRYLAGSGKAHPVSAELRMRIEDGKPVEVRIGGGAFDPSRHYYVLTSDYLQHGGDKMYFFKDPVHLHVLDYKIRQALLDEFRDIDTLELHKDGRILRIP